MQVILLDKVINLGGLGEQVNVKGGYARNYLVPQGKAVPATPKNIARFQARRIELEAKIADMKAIAQERAAKINKLGSITITAKAGEEGKLFGSIGARAIANAITALGVNVIKKEVRLPNGILRAIGTYDIKIQIHNDICATISLLIVPEI